MERNFPVTLLFLLHSVDECAIRKEKVKKCRSIDVRSKCLVSKNKKFEVCVWCPDGACAKKPEGQKQTCLSRVFAKKLGVFDYEDCLPAGTQNGCSGSNYS